MQESISVQQDSSSCSSDINAPGGLLLQTILSVYNVLLNIETAQDSPCE